MNKLRKIFTASVMVMTLAVMLGFGSFAQAATPQAGDLIKMDGLSTVYFLGNDSKRYVFPHESVFFSWHRDFSGVVTVSASELQSYPLGANVTMRPGTKLVKITTDPSVYAVEPNGVLRKIQSESDAIAIYGPNWAKRVVDVADSFFTNYTIGQPLASGEIAAGTLVKKSDDATVYYFDGTNYRPVASESAFYANRFSFNDVITVTKEISPKANAISNNEFAYDAQNATGPVTTASGVTVSLSSATPAAQNIPSGSSVDFLKINLTAANDGQVNVSSIKLTAYGLSDATKIDNVTFYDNNVKVGTSKDINSDREAIFNFATPIYIAAGSTKTLTVKATVADDSGSYGLGIAKASDIISSGATVNGSFPLTGNLMSAVESSVGSITIDATAVSSNPSFGEDDVLLADFNLDVDDENALLQSISLYNGGTNADDIVSNLKLVIDGTEVASGVYANRYATFSINNYEIEKGENASIEVRGDIGVTSAGDKIELYLKDTADLVAVGKTHGFSLQVINEELIDSLNSVVLGTGDFTIDMDKAATPSKDVKPGDKDVVLATIVLKSNGENAIIDGIKPAGFYVISNEATSSLMLENAELVDLSTGGVYDLDIATSSITTNQTLELSDEIFLTKGVAKKFAVRADVLDAVEEDTTFRVYLAGTALDIEGEVSGAKIDNITPSSVTGSIITVKEASLDVLPTVLNDVTVVGGANDVVVYSAKVKAGTADSVKIQSLKLTGDVVASTSPFTDNNITKLELFLNGNLLKSVSNQISEANDTATGTITFNSLNTAYNTVAAGAEVVLEVKASFASTLTTGSFALSLDASGDISARSVDGNDPVTPTTTSTDSRTVTVASVGSLKVELLTSNVLASQDQYILAGATSSPKYMGELKFTTEDEPIKLTDLTLDDTGTANNGDLAAVQLVKADGTVVASESVNADGDAIFDNMNIVLEANKATSLFILPIAKGINVANDPTSTATQGATINYKITNVAAQGVNSAEDLNMVGAAAAAANKWDNDAITKTFTITGVKLNTVVNAMSNGKLSGGNQDIAKYTLTFENGNNRNLDNEAYLAQLDEFVLTVNQTGATTTNYALSVEGTNRWVTATSANVPSWSKATLIADDTGLLDAAKLNNVVTLVISADVELDTTANNYSVQTRIADLDGLSDDDIQFSGLKNMFLPVTGVTGATLSN